MVDRYTKVVLTVIAAALLVIVAQGGIGGARAQSDTCGTMFSPCWVHVNSSSGDPVWTTTLP